MFSYWALGGLLLLAAFFALLALWPYGRAKAPVDSFDHDAAELTRSLTGAYDTRTATNPLTGEVYYRERADGFRPPSGPSPRPRPQS